MAKFNIAVKWLKEGLPVRREAWNRGEHINSIPHSLLTIHDALQDDWVVYHPASPS